MYKKHLLIAITAAILQTGCNSSNSENTAVDPYNIDDLKLTQIVNAYSHNSYDSKDDRWPFDDIYAQLEGGIRTLELDLYGTDGSIAHDDDTVAPHCHRLDHCLSYINDWSLQNPNHSPIFVQIEMHDNGELIEDGDQLTTPEMEMRTRIVRDKVDTIADSLEEYQQQGRLITYEESLNPIIDLRGKLIVTLYRKYATPYYSVPENHSPRQSLTLNDALELDQDSSRGQYYRTKLAANNVFVSPRYLGADSPDNWNFVDPDYKAMVAMEKHVGLENKMLQVLKQDKSYYLSELMTDNLFMVSNSSADSDASYDSIGNSFGTHGFEALQSDPLVNTILTSSELALPHCQRSGRIAQLSHCITQNN